MISLAVNDENDIYLNSAGNLATVTGIQAVLQQCAQVMKLFLGEAVYAQTRGIPYMETVFDRTILDQFEASAREALESIDGVTEVAEFSPVVNGSTLAYSALIITIYGEGRING